MCLSVSCWLLRTWSDCWSFMDFIHSVCCSKLSLLTLIFFYYCTHTHTYPTCTHTCTYMHTHIHVHTHTHEYTCTCIHACMNIYITHTCKTHIHIAKMLTKLDMEMQSYGPNCPSVCLGWYLTWDIVVCFWWPAKQKEYVNPQRKRQNSLQKDVDSQHGPIRILSRLEVHGDNK